MINYNSIAYKKPSLKMLGGDQEVWLGFGGIEISCLWNWSCSFAV